MLTNIWIFFLISETLVSFICLLLFLFLVAYDTWFSIGEETIVSLFFSVAKNTYIYTYTRTCTMNRVILLLLLLANSVFPKANFFNQNENWSKDYVERWLDKFVSKHEISGKTDFYDEVYGAFVGDHAGLAENDDEKIEELLMAWVWEG